jgi:MFS family permease
MQIQLPSTFRALRHPNYRLWFVGQGISLIGTWMQTMAQQVLIYRLTGSAASLGAINFVGLIPFIPLTLWGGSISDRFPKRTVLLLTQTFMLFQAIILAGLTWSGTIQVWHVYVMAFLLSAAQGVDLPARQVFTIDMVEGKNDLTNAIGLNSAIFNGARALGPALAGLVIAATGEAMAFFLNGLSFVAVIFSLLLMRNLPRPSMPTRKDTPVLAHLAEGFQYMRKQQAIILLTSLVALSAFLSMPYSTLMPVFAEDILKTSSRPVIEFICGGNNPIIHCQSPEALPLGLLLTMVGVGALIGALLVASLPTTTPRGRFLTAGNLLFPFLLLLFSFSRSFTLSLAIMLLTGISFVMQNALANTLIQLASPDAMRGRIMSLYTLTFQGMMRLGGMQAGLVADWIGAPLSVALGAAISLIYGGFIAIRFPKIRKL